MTRRLLQSRRLTTPPTSKPGGGSTQAAGKTVEFRPGPRELNRVAFMRRRRIVDNVLRFGTPIALLVLWQVAAEAELIESRFWPPPTKIFSAGLDAIESGVLQDALAVSVQRILIGFTLGSIVGILIGILLGTVRPLRVALDPILSALYTVPKLAILPLLFLVFGLGDSPKIILIAMSAFFITAISTMAATIAIPGGYLETADAFGAKSWQRFRHVLVPAILPDVFVSLRLAVGTSVLVMVGIEFVQGGEGIGWLIWNSWQLYITDRMYVGIVAVALVGVVLQSAVQLLGRRIAPWADASQGR